MPLKKTKLLVVLAAGLACVFLGSVLINAVVSASARGRITSPAEARPARAILLLGAKVYPDGRVSAVVEDRVRTAAEVYRAGKSKKILVSGDHGTNYYDEVDAIRKRLTAAGIPEEDIFLDHAGFNTYDSLYRARSVFGADSLIVVTQRFHIARALFLADRFGIRAEGVAADRRTYRDEARNELREFLARVAAFFNAVVFRPRPKFLGPPIDLSGDGRVTR
ncbi:MAG: YdcF family protein [Spirochaetales bacterium]|nr:YdcF family protein [Spirochaetales bacterium]